ncbi:MAG: hypothetical protein H7836_09680 [Magnetococcus sp. YQC-3]
MDALKEKVARIICYHEVVANAVDTAGSLEDAYKTDDVDSIVQEIVDRAWREHLSTARKIVSLCRASMRVTRSSSRSLSSSGA